MKNFFETNNSDEKISDKAFKQSLVISVLCILFCMIGLCSITYAWFTKETKSQTNSITSGSFKLEVLVEQIETVDGNTTVVATIDVAESNGVYRCTLPLEGATYRVTLTRTDLSTSNGYCYVKVGSHEKQATGKISDINEKHSADTNPFIFFVVAEVANTTLELTPCWGVNGSPKVEYGGIAPVVISSNE